MRPFLPNDREVTALDSPKISGPSCEGRAPGVTYQHWVSFRQFLRLQIGTKWYRVGPDLDWGMVLKAVIGTDNKWHDDGSDYYPKD